MEEDAPCQRTWCLVWAAMQQYLPVSIYCNLIWQKFNLLLYTRNLAIPWYGYIFFWHKATFMGHPMTADVAAIFIALKNGRFIDVQDEFWKVKLSSKAEWINFPSSRSNNWLNIIIPLEVCGNKGWRKWKWR